MADQAETELRQIGRAVRSAHFDGGTDAGRGECFLQRLAALGLQIVPRPRSKDEAVQVALDFDPRSERITIAKPTVIDRRFVPFEPIGEAARDAYERDIFDTRTEDGSDDD
jgi:hypothetical protein